MEFVNLLFESELDKQKFLLEENLLSIPLDNKINIDENTLLNRLNKFKLVKNYRKSNIAKHQWKVMRPKMLKGILKFHKSTVGKMFHKTLGRKLATRDFKSKISMIETLGGLNSLKTHLLIGCKYTSSMDEEIDYEIFVEESIYRIDEIYNKFYNLVFNTDNLIDLTDEEESFLKDLIIEDNNNG